MIGVALSLRALGDLGAQIPQVWGLLLVALAGYLLGAWCVARGKARLPLVLLTAGIMRLVIVSSEPTLSDDIYRYLWDGRVQLAGINPYAHAPGAVALAHLRDDVWERVNHPQVPTVYPPLAQWYFALVVACGGGVLALKLGLVLCEGLIMVAVVGLLNSRGRDPCWVLLYAWHPLPLLEIAGSGHIDAMGVAGLMIGLLWLNQGRRWLAATGVATAILAKLVPAVCILGFWQYWRKGQGLWSWLDPRPRWPLLLTAVLVGGAYAPYLLDNAAIFDGLRTYALKWRFNDGLFTVVYELLRDQRLAWDDAALLLARQICVAMWLCVAVLAMRWSEPPRICFALLGSYIVLAPTVHPWYLLWILPFVPLIPNPAWLVWSWLILLSYEVLIGYHANGQWAPANWVKWVQYVPFFVLLIGDVVRGKYRLHRSERRAAAEEQTSQSDVM